MELAPGARVGSYEILAPLGAGGMGTVYRSRDPRLGRELAIKILQEKLLGNREYLGRFEQEARSASALNHPNIITIYEIGEAHGAPFIAMELVDGTRLRDVIKAGPLPLRKLLNIATQIAAGLAAAHDRGIVHRDLKPENVMITPDGLVKILDFGLARLRHDAAPEDESTSELFVNATYEGAVIGTTGYMSPEQASGAQVDFRSDQFSFGSILYEMATGKRAFRKETPLDTLSAIVHDDAEPIERLNPKIPQPLRWAIERCMAKDPRDRYASTRDLARDLQTLRDHHGDTTTGEVPTAPAPRYQKRLTLGVAALVLAAAAGVVSIYLRSNDTVPQDPERIQLAILPFQDLTGDPKGELFGRGFAETVGTRLRKANPELSVIAPSAAAQLLEQKAPLRRLAEELGANMFLQASVQRAGDDLRVSFALLEPKGTQVGGDTVTGPESSLFSLQDQLAESVISELNVRSVRLQRDQGLTNGEDQARYVEAIGYLQRYDDPKQVQSATQLLEELRQRAPGSALVHAALARAYLYQYRLGNDPAWTDRIIKTSERARQLDPTLPDVHLTLGETKLLTGATADAIREFQLALARQPNSSEALIGLAQAFGKAGNTKEAESTYRRAIALQPERWSGYAKLGGFYFSQGMYEEAATMFAEVVRRSPDNKFAYSNLGSAQLMVGDFGAALAAFTKAIELGDAAAWSNLGTCYYYLGRYDDAIREYLKSVEASPHLSTAWANLGDAYRASSLHVEEQRAYRRAIELATEEVRLNPTNGAAHGTLARCYAKLGNHKSAAEHINLALKAEPDNPYRMVNAAMVENLAGNEVVAAQWLERAFKSRYPRAFAEKEPDFENLRKKNLLIPIARIPKTKQASTLR